MKLGEAISKVEELMSINGAFDLTESGDSIQATFSASRPFHENAGPGTEDGEGSFTIINNGGGNFEPSEASFQGIFEGTDLHYQVWKWDGEYLQPLDEKGQPIPPKRPIEVA